MKDPELDYPYWVELCSVDDEVQVGTLMVGDCPRGAYKVDDRNIITGRVYEVDDNGKLEAITILKNYFMTVEHVKNAITGLVLARPREIVWRRRRTKTMKTVYPNEDYL